VLQRTALWSNPRLMLVTKLWSSPRSVAHTNSGVKLLPDYVMHNRQPMMSVMQSRQFAAKRQLQQAKLFDVEQMS